MQFTLITVVSDYYTSTTDNSKISVPHQIGACSCQLSYKSNQVQLTATLIILLLLILDQLSHSLQKMKTAAVLCVLLAAALAAEGPSNCYRTCSGVAKEWLVGDHTGGDDKGMVKVAVDLTSCGFTSAPHLSTELVGTSHNVQTKGAASGVRELTAEGFSLNIFKDLNTARDGDAFQITTEIATASNWEIYWTASGYGC